MTLTARDIHHLRQVRSATCRGGSCAQHAAATELAEAARAAAPDLADSDIAARLLRLTTSDDPAEIWLIALTAAAVAGPVLDQEPTHV